jgi:hypothetical protein
MATNHGMSPENFLSFDGKWRIIIIIDEGWLPVEGTTK